MNQGNIITESQIEGEFEGFDEDAIFELTNGEVWQQSRYQYRYQYAYRPNVVIWRHSSGLYFMDVDGIDESIEVVQVNVLSQGVIVSPFQGYRAGEKFEFQNGSTWQQTTNRTRVRHRTRPRGIVVNGVNGLQLHVEGIDGVVKVRRV